MAQYIDDTLLGLVLLFAGFTLYGLAEAVSAWFAALAEQATANARLLDARAEAVECDNDRQGA